MTRHGADPGGHVEPLRPLASRGGGGSQAATALAEPPAVKPSAGTRPLGTGKGGWNASTKSSPVWKRSKENSLPQPKAGGVSSKYRNVPSKLSSYAPMFQRRAQQDATALTQVDPPRVAGEDAQGMIAGRQDGVRHRSNPTRSGSSTEASASSMHSAEAELQAFALDPGVALSRPLAFDFVTSKRGSYLPEAFDPTAAVHASLGSSPAPLHDYQPADHMQQLRGARSPWDLRAGRACEPNMQESPSAPQSPHPSLAALYQFAAEVRTPGSSSRTPISDPAALEATPSECEAMVQAVEALGDIVDAPAEGLCGTFGTWLAAMGFAQVEGAQLGRLQSLWAQAKEAASLQGLVASLKESELELARVEAEDAHRHMDSLMAQNQDLLEAKQELQRKLEDAQARLQQLSMLPPAPGPFQGSLAQEQVQEPWPFSLGPVDEEGSFVGAFGLAFGGPEDGPEHGSFMGMEGDDADEVLTDGIPPDAEQDLEAELSPLGEEDLPVPETAISSHVEAQLAVPAAAGCSAAAPADLVESPAALSDNGGSIRPMRLRFQPSAEKSTTASISCSAAASGAAAGATNEAPTAAASSLSTVSRSQPRVPYDQWAASQHAGPVSFSSSQQVSGGDSYDAGVAAFTFGGADASSAKSLASQASAGLSFVSAAPAPVPYRQWVAAVAPATASSSRPLRHAVDAAGAAGIRSNPVFEDDDPFSVGMPSPLPQLASSLKPGAASSPGPRLSSGSPAPRLFPHDAPDDVEQVVEEEVDSHRSQPSSPRTVQFGDTSLDSPFNFGGPLAAAGLLAGQTLDAAFVAAGPAPGGGPTAASGCSLTEITLGGHGEPAAGGGNETPQMKVKGRAVTSGATGIKPVPAGMLPTAGSSITTTLPDSAGSSPVDEHRTPAAAPGTPSATSVLPMTPTAMPATPFESFVTPASCFAATPLPLGQAACSPSQQHDQPSPAFSFGAALEALAPSLAALLTTPGFKAGPAAGSTRDGASSDGALLPVSPQRGGFDGFGSPFVLPHMTPEEAAQLQELAASAVALFAASPLSAAAGEATAGGGSPKAEGAMEAGDNADSTAAAAAFSLAALLAHLRSPRRLAVGTPHQQPALPHRAMAAVDVGVLAGAAGTGESPQALQDSPADSETASLGFGFSTAAKQMAMRGTPATSVAASGMTFGGWHGPARSGGEQTPNSFSFRPQGLMASGTTSTPNLAGAVTPTLASKQQHAAAAAAAAASPLGPNGSPMPAFSFAAMLQQLQSPMPGRAALPASPAFSFALPGMASSTAGTPMAFGMPRSRAAGQGATMPPSADGAGQDGVEASPHTPPTGASPALSLYDWAGVLGDVSPLLFAAAGSQMHLSPEAAGGFTFDALAHALASATETPAPIGHGSRFNGVTQPALAALPQPPVTALAALLQQLQSPLPQPAARKAAAAAAARPEQGSGARAAMPPGSEAQLPPAAAPAAFWSALLQQLQSPLPQVGRHHPFAAGMRPVAAAQLQALQSSSINPAADDDASSCSCPRDAGPVVNGNAGASQPVSSAGAPPPPYEALDELTALGVCVPATAYSLMVGPDVADATPKAGQLHSPQLVDSPFEACSSVGECATPGVDMLLGQVQSAAGQGPALAAAGAAISTPTTACMSSASEVRLFAYTPRRQALLQAAGSPAGSGDARRPVEAPLQLQSFSASTRSDSSPTHGSVSGAAASPARTPARSVRGPLQHSSPVVSYHASPLGASSAPSASPAGVNPGSAGRRLVPIIMAPAPLLAAGAAPGPQQQQAGPVVMMVELHDVRDVVRSLSSSAANTPEAARSRASAAAAAAAIASVASSSGSFRDVEADDVRQLLFGTSGSKVGSPAPAASAGTPAATPTPAAVGAESWSLAATPGDAQTAALPSVSPPWSSKPSIYEGVTTPDNCSPFSYMGQQDDLPATTPELLAAFAGSSLLASPAGWCGPAVEGRMAAAAPCALVAAPAGSAAPQAMYWAPDSSSALPRSSGACLGERVTLAAPNRRITASSDMLLDFQGSPAGPKLAGNKAISSRAQLQQRPAGLGPPALGAPHATASVRASFPGAAASPYSGATLAGLLALDAPAAIPTHPLAGGHTAYLGASPGLASVPEAQQQLALAATAAPRRITISQMLGLRPLDGAAAVAAPGRAPGRSMLPKPPQLAAPAATDARQPSGPASRVAPAAKSVRTADAQTTPGLAKAASSHASSAHVGTATGHTPVVAAKQLPPDASAMHTFTFDFKVQHANVITAVGGTIASNKENAGGAGAAQLLMHALDVAAKAATGGATAPSRSQRPTGGTAQATGAYAVPISIAEEDEGESEDVDEPARRPPSQAAQRGGSRSMTDSEEKRVKQQAKALGVRISPYLRASKHQH